MFLRSLSRHLNSTVFRGPDDGNGSGTDGVIENDVGDESIVEDADDGGAADSDGGQSDEPRKPLSVREELKRSIEEVRRADEKAAKTVKRGAKAKAEPQEPVAAAPPKAPVAPQDDIPAPAALSAEAKQAWAAAPKEIKEAFIKREADMQRGVDELRQKYKGIDDALSPHADALRQMNATPAMAVDRMFLWFKALSGTPASSFPALAQSMGIDWNKLVAATTRQQPQAGQPPAVDGAAADGAPQIPSEIREYIGQLEQQIANLNNGIQQFGGRFQTMEESVNAQNMARTTENLNIWSKDKPYFDEVRVDMAHLLQSGLIPLKPDGQVDLDTAYERAIYYNPEVRAKVIAEQQQANQKAQAESEKAATTAQQAQTEKARKAAVSLPARNTPGEGNPSKPQQARKPGQRTSVRDSLKAAIAELRDQ